MSKAIQKVGSFLKLLLNTTQKQVRALFHSLNPAQTFAICEILFNIQKLPVSARVLKEVKKRKHLFKRLSDKSIKLEKRLSLIQTHYRQIQAILLLVKREILGIVE